MGNASKREKLIRNWRKPPSQFTKLEEQVHQLDQQLATLRAESLESDRTLSSLLSMSQIVDEVLQSLDDERKIVKTVSETSVRETPLGLSGWNSPASGDVSFHIRQGTGGAFQYFGVHNWSNPQNAPETPKVLKKMGPS